MHSNKGMLLKDGLIRSSPVGRLSGPKDRTYPLAPSSPWGV